MSSPQIKRNYNCLYIFTMVLYVSISVFSYLYFASDLNKTKSFEEENARAVAEARMIQDFTLEFGYGAFIHNYKNYLVRGSPKYYEAAIENYRKMEVNLIEIKEINRGSKEYLQNIAVIRKTMEKYYSNLQNLKGKYTSRDIAEVDQMIKLNDAPAVNAIKWIEQAIIKKQYKIKVGFTDHVHHMIRMLNIISFSLIFFFVGFFTFVFFKIKELHQKSDEERQNRIHLARVQEIQEIQEMSGSIAHEINNPLMIISGSAVSLTKMLKRKEPMIERAIGKADMITETVERISAIIKSMKNLTYKSESKTWQNFELSDALNDVLNLSQERFKFANLKVEVEGNPDVGLYGQRNQIGQVILNLFNNSFDAIKDEKSKWIKVIIRECEDIVEIDVMDSGPEIPSSVADKLMDPFFTTKEIGKGTGIGLSICKSILKDHGGDIELLRGVSHTTFRVTLPTRSVSTKLAA